MPLLDLKPQFQAMRDDIERAIRRVVDSQMFILGPEVAAFEQEIAAYVGVPHAIGCASGTDALVLSLHALDLRPGDEVVTTPFSFFATASCITRHGGIPVFVDIDPHTFNLDPARVEAALTPRTKAILPVHLFGQCADMDPILALAKARGIAVVEDACQAIGATYRGKGAGSMGTTGAFSFFPSKNLGAFGDGGVVTTHDDALAARLKMLRVHGERERYKHQAIGWNSRLDALQAAVLRVKLKHLDAWSKGRIANADRYDRLFESAGLVASGRVALPVRAPSGGHIFNQYTIRVKGRDALGEHLKARGIGWAVYYPIPLHLQECFASLGYREGDMPHTEAAAAEVLSLPIYPELDPSQLERVVEEIAAFSQKAIVNS
ncbi:MAG TPA: DegT/DnrJ/EryC1/StrS family aminotransferase [Candidatus Polarisedimenticolaceae bacterium]|nr:DegT/DnrJ/EryC1/StrS family aminotransferase [Candidatus Polarisedimenticolaceae bacterium]